MLAKNASVPTTFASLGRPCAMNAVPAMILIGKGPNDINLCRSDMFNLLLEYTNGYVMLINYFVIQG